MTYDGLERLTAVTTTNPESFTLDAASNITARTGPAKTFTIDGSNRPTGDGTNTLTWSAADRLTGRGSDTFGFDPLDRLTSSTVAGTARTYAYNGDGLLQSRTTAGSTANLLWDPTSSPSRLLASGSDKIVYGLGPLYAVNGTTVTTYARDGQKSIRAELNGTTVTSSWRYRAYGEIAQYSGAAAPSILGYAGQLLDPSGLYYMRARWYDAGNARFLSSDPSAGNVSLPASVNRSAYANANALTYSDPTGYCVPFCLALAALVAPEGIAALSAVVTTVSIAASRYGPAIVRFVSAAATPTERLTESLAKPNVTYPALRRIVDYTYRATATVGTGSTADMIRNEVASGEMCQRSYRRDLKLSID
jgi:RHS repeat-associated protein